MTHTIEVTGIPEEMLERLDSRARERHATDRSEYVRELIARDLSSGPEVSDTPAAKKEKTMAEVLAPIQESVRQSGMTTEEVNALLDETLRDVRWERRRKREDSRPTAHE